MSNRFDVECTTEDIDELSTTLTEQANRLDITLTDLSEHLNSDGRESLIRVALYFALIDGQLSEDEMQLIRSAASNIGLTNANLRGLIDQVLEHD